MLRQLRSRKVTKRIMFWTLVLVIPSFVFFYGWQSSSKRRAGRDGIEREGLVLFKDRWFGLRERYSSPMAEELARRTLQQEYLYMFRSQQMQVAPEEVRSLIGPAEVARQVMTAYYLDRLVRQMGLQVTEEEVQRLVEGMLGGRPVEDLRRQLQREGMTEQELVEDLAYRQGENKGKNVIYSLAKASLFELWQEYLISQEKIQIRYVVIPTQDFEKQVQPTTDSLRAFYQAHGDNYRVGDRAEFRYVAVFRSDVEKDIHPTTDSVRAFYEKNKDKLYSRKRSATVRHIFLRVPADASTTVALAAETLIRDIAAKIKGGAGFEAMADQFSQDTDNVDPRDPTRKHGGLLPMPIGEDSKTVLGDEFKNAALTLAANEVSSPVKTALGWELIKADQVTTAGVRSFDEAKDQVRLAVLEEMTDAEFRKRGEHLKTLFNEKSYSTLDSFAQATSMPIGQTGMVGLESGFLPKIGPVSDNLDLIKAMAVGEFSEAVLKTPEAYFVLELKSKEPSHIPPFDQVVKDVQEDYLTSSSASLAHQSALDMIRQAKNLEDLQKLAEQKGYQLKQSDLVTRDKMGDVLPNLDPKFRVMTLRGKVGSTGLTSQGDPKRPIAYVVWFFEKSEQPSQEQFRKDLPSLRAEYLTQVQDALVLEWLHDMERRIPARMNPIYETKKAEEEKKTE